MDVVCDRCQTHYEFEDALVSERGTTVKCTNCQHQFKIYRAAGNGPAGSWTLRRGDGSSMTFESLGVLQRWIANGEVERTDLLARSGGEWKQLGVIAELIPFFEAAQGENRTTRMPSADVILAARGHRPITPADVPTAPSRPNQKTPGGSLPPMGAGVSGGHAKPAIGPPPMAQGVVPALPVVPPTPSLPAPGVPSGRPPVKGGARRGPGDVTERLDALSPERLRAMGLASDEPEPKKGNGLLAGIAVALGCIVIAGAIGFWKLGVFGPSTAANSASASASVSASATGSGSAAPVSASAAAANARLALARALIAQGDTRGAREQINAVLATMPDYADAVALRATLPAEPSAATAAPSVVAPSASASASAPAVVPSVAAPSASASAPSAAPSGSAGERPSGRSSGGSEPGTGGGGGGAPTARGYDGLISEGERALGRGRRDQARAAFMAALVVRPDGSEATTGLGFVELDGGSAGVAVSHFRRALSINPRYSDAMLGLGDAYRRQGNTSEALRAYRDYLRTNPGGSRADFVQRQITALEGGSGGSGGSGGGSEGTSGNGASPGSSAVPSPGP